MLRGSCKGWRLDKKVKEDLWGGERDGGLGVLSLGLGDVSPLF